MNENTHAKNNNLLFFIKKFYITIVSLAILLWLIDLLNLQTAIAQLFFVILILIDIKWIQKLFFPQLDTTTNVVLTLVMLIVAVLSPAWLIFAPNWTSLYSKTTGIFQCEVQHSFTLGDGNYR